MRTFRAPRAKAAKAPPTAAAMAAVVVVNMLIAFHAPPGRAQAAVTVPCRTGGAALVKAVETVNAAGSGTVILAPHCTYTLKVPQDADRDGLPTVTGNVAVIGNSSTITRAPAAAPFRILKVAGHGRLTLVSTTVSGGRAAARPGQESLGGGIDNNGRLVLRSSTLTGNTADRGAGLHNGPHAHATIEGTAITANDAAVAGGGIANLGTITADRCVLGANRAVVAGALFNADHTAAVTGTGRTTLTRCRVSGNTARVLGGGLYSTGSHSSLTVVSVTLSGNVSGGGAGGVFVSAGSAVLNHSTVTGNTAGATGGGLSGNFASVALRSSSIIGNRADKGGGIYAPPGATVTLTSSRVRDDTPDDCAPAGSVTGCRPAGPRPPHIPVTAGVRSAVVCLSQLPPEAITTIRLIRHHGAFPYPQDGAVFGNFEDFLPYAPSGYYHEYTVMTPGAPDRGARRIVTGDHGEEYYSDDHYAAFRRILLAC